MVLLLARTVGHSVQRDDGKCSSLRLTRNRFVLHRHPAMSLGVGETRLILLEDFLVLLLCPGGQGFWWMVSDVDLLQIVCLFHLRSGIQFVHFFLGVNNSFALSHVSFADPSRV